MPATLQQMVPVQALADYLRALHAGSAAGDVVDARALGGLAEAAELDVALLGEGRSNLTFRVRGGSTTLVLRRPPLGDIPETAHDMGREYRVLCALADAPVRTPRPVAACRDPDVLGQPFYLMHEVPGVVARQQLPEAYAETDRERVGLEMVDALAELHAVDPQAVGLGDLGRGDGYVERQVRRWTRQWEVMATRELPDIERVRDWLAARVPEQRRTTLVHGDYKLDNVVLSPGPPAELRAVLDWEMTTRGDPLADLGYLTVFWPHPGEQSLRSGEQLPSQQEGAARRAALVARYAARSGLGDLDEDDLAYYRVLAAWKLAVLSEGLYKRHLAGKTTSDYYASLQWRVPAMAELAREWAGIGGA